MRKFIILAICLFIAIGTMPASAAKSDSAFKAWKPFVCNIDARSAIDSDCTFKGIKLYGRVKIVTAFPDIKVQVVDSFPDLKVQVVNSFPDKCGKWQFVNSFPDFTIQYVDSFPDIKIKFVEHFPGKP